MTIRRLFLLTCLALALSIAKAQSLLPSVQNVTSGISGFSAGGRYMSTDIENSSGNMVVVWQEQSNLTGNDVWMAMYDKNLTLLPGVWPMLVNQTVNGDQEKPTVKIDQVSGNFVVGWLGDVGGAVHQVFARAFKPDGNVFSSVYASDVVVSSTAFPKTSIRFTWDDNGNFFPAFGKRGQMASEYLYINKVPVATGLPSTDVPIQPLPNVYKQHFLGDLDWDPAVGIVVSWHSQNTNVNQAIVKTRIFDSNLNALSTEIDVNGGLTGEYDISLDIHRSTKTVLYCWTRRQVSNRQVKAKSVKVLPGGTGIQDDLSVFTLTGNGNGVKNERPLGMWSELTGHFLIAYDYTEPTLAPNNFGVKVSIHRYCFSETGLSGKQLVSPVQTVLTNGGSNYKPSTFFAEYSTDLWLLPFAWEKTNGAGTIPMVDLWKLSPERSYAVLYKQDDANLYPTNGDLLFVEYVQKEVPSMLNFEFYDDLSKSWLPLNYLTSSIVGPNKYVFNVSSLTNNQTYLVRIINPKGDEEYLRILKRRHSPCSICIGCE